MICCYFIANMLTYQINIEGDAICSSELLHGQRHHCFFIAMGIDDIDHRLHVCTGDSIHELIQEFVMSNISDHVKI